MKAVAMGTRFRFAENGANLPGMDTNRLYPHPEKGEEAPRRVRLSVHVSEQAHEDIEFFGDLWTAYDRAQGLQRRRWKNQSVVERFVQVGLEGLWAQLKVKRPETKEEREELLRRAVAQFEKVLKQK